MRISNLSHQAFLPQCGMGGLETQIDCDAVVVNRMMILLHLTIRYSKRIKAFYTFWLVSESFGKGQNRFIELTQLLMGNATCP